MTLRRLNLVMALVAFAGSVGWLLAGLAPTGVIWFAVSLAWLMIAIWRIRDSTLEPRPLARFGRRLSRLLMWS